MRLRRTVTSDKQDTTTQVSRRKTSKVRDLAILDRRIEDLLEKNKQLAQITEELDRLKDSLYLALKTNGISEYSHLGVELQEVEDKTRRSTEIDPAKYYDAVEDIDLFLSTITVPVTKARKALSEREIEAIATITEPVVRGKKLKISMPKL